MGNCLSAGDLTVLLLGFFLQGQSASIRQLVMQAMAEWYVKGDMDQGRLSRILDVAQDLKARISTVKSRQR